MAEFLIYNKTHWMDEPSKDRPDLLGYDNVTRKINEGPMLAANRSKALSLHWQKYTSRYRPGDIVEVRKDGAPSGRLEKTGVDFIRVPIAFENATQYMKPHMDGETLLHRRMYQIDMTGIVLSDHEASLTVAEFNSRLKVRK